MIDKEPYPFCYLVPESMKASSVCLLHNSRCLLLGTPVPTPALGQVPFQGASTPWKVTWGAKSSLLPQTRNMSIFPQLGHESEQPQLSHDPGILLHGCGDLQLVILKGSQTCDKTVQERPENKSTPRGHSHSQIHAPLSPTILTDREQLKSAIMKTEQDRKGHICSAVI